MLSVGSDHIKLLQPGLKVARNLNGLYSQGFPKLPQPEPEVANSPDDLYVIV